jgi:hypothetical protein
VFEAKFMLPWSFSEEMAAERRPNSSITCGSPNATGAVLSIITGGGKWVEIKISADSLYPHLLLTAEKKFWRCGYCDCERSERRGAETGAAASASQSRGPAAQLTAFSLPFAEPNARASAAVFINEHNARGF